MKKVFTIVLIIMLVGSFLGTGFFLFNKSQEKEVIYETDSLFVTDIIQKTVATGSINPRKEVDMKSIVSGVVEKLFVEPGEHVKTGQLIAKIRIIPDVVALNNAQANLEQAIINFKNSKRELQRQKDLFEQKVISEFEYNQFLLTYNLNKQQVEAAENNLELVKEGASKRSGNVSNLVESTVDGMVLDVPIKEGNFVIESNTFNEGTTIATVADMSEMIFEGNVDESEVGKLREGMELKLKIGALDTTEFIATLEYIAPKGVEDQGAIQFEVRAAINIREDVFLRAGYSANADIVLARKQDVLSIKESNVIFEDNDAFVEVMVEEQEFEKKPIQLGLSDGINVEVLDGLTADSRVKKL
jgi:HlyD family secretion protein